VCVCVRAHTRTRVLVGVRVRASLIRTLWAAGSWSAARALSGSPSSSKRSSRLATLRASPPVAPSPGRSARVSSLLSSAAWRGGMQKWGGEGGKAEARHVSKACLHEDHRGSSHQAEPTPPLTPHHTDRQSRAAGARATSTGHVCCTPTPDPTRALAPAHPRTCAEEGGREG